MTNRDLGAELLEAIREIKRGGGRRYEVEVRRDVTDRDIPLLTAATKCDKAYRIRQKPVTRRR